MFIHQCLEMQPTSIATSRYSSIVVRATWIFFSAKAFGKVMVVVALLFTLQGTTEANVFGAGQCEKKGNSRTVDVPLGEDDIETLNVSCGGNYVTSVLCTVEHNDNNPGLQLFRKLE